MVLGRSVTVDPKICQKYVFNQFCIDILQKMETFHSFCLFVHILVYCNHDLFQHTRLLDYTRTLFSCCSPYTRLLWILV